MKLTFVPKDGKTHVYCISCRRETAKATAHDAYRCTSCGHTSRRALIIDPAVKWWLGKDGEYWHENAGVFLRDQRGRYLFLKRAKYPSGLTIPIGHVDRGEAPVHTAARELFEEAGVRLAPSSLRHVVTEDMLDDQCRRGSDVHRWNVYAAPIGPRVALKVNRTESSAAEWLTLEQALNSPLVPVMRQVVAQHKAAVERALRA